MNQSEFHVVITTKCLAGMTEHSLSLA